MRKGGTRLVRGLRERPSAPGGWGGGRLQQRSPGLTENSKTNLPQLFPPLPRAKITPSLLPKEREQFPFWDGGVTAAERATTPPSTAFG